jgi:hypothetical protein
MCKRLSTLFLFFLSFYAIPNWLLSAEAETGCKCSAQCSAAKCSCCGGWFVAETDNFQACCLDSEASAKGLAQAAEKLRTNLESKWLGDDSQKKWTPKCQIIVHSSQQSYVTAVGRGSGQTVGSSLVKVEKDQIRSRRIDLLGGRADLLSAALPHELTHVVLKDRFLMAPLPRWADEGAAVLADDDSKQARHQHDLEESITHRTTFDTGALLTLEEYPGANRIGAFYGQSASLVKFLVDQKNPRQFIDFVELAGKEGYDAALRDCYGLESARQLDRLWSRELRLVSTVQNGVDARRFSAN